MVDPSRALLFDMNDADELEPQHATGLLPAQHLKGLVEHSREIRATEPIEADQVQPASLDLRLGETAFRVRSSFLPGPDRSVAERIGALKLHEIDLRDGAKKAWYEG